MKPYGLIADVHLHAWSAFAKVTPEGLNSRLEGLLSEIKRAAKAVRDAGGDTLIVAGDLFHVRGQLAPSVLNPAMDAFKHLRALGLHVVIIPGNHDLEGKNSERLGSAVTALEGVGCTVTPDVHQHGSVIVLPWVESVRDLQGKIDAIVADYDGSLDKLDLILHAPINGVIMGIPDSGLDPAELAALGFRRVFAGHYHNHKVFEGGKVVSIGALAHHSWSDVGSVAGFLLVYPDRIEHHPSQLPQFIDVQPTTPAEEVERIAKGNFVRIRTDKQKPAEIDAMRKWLEQKGALGTVVITTRAPVAERTGATIQAGASIQQSVSEFIAGLNIDPSIDRVRVGAQALKVLAEAEAV